MCKLNKKLEEFITDRFEDLRVAATNGM